MLVAFTFSTRKTKRINSSFFIEFSRAFSEFNVNRKPCPDEKRFLRGFSCCFPLCGKLLESSSRLLLCFSSAWEKYFKVFNHRRDIIHDWSMNFEMKSILGFSLETSNESTRTKILGIYCWIRKDRFSERLDKDQGKAGAGRLFGCIRSVLPAMSLSIAGERTLMSGFSSNAIKNSPTLVTMPSVWEKEKRVSEKKVLRLSFFFTKQTSSWFDAKFISENLCYTIL